jgi:hypothetical protein
MSDLPASLVHEIDQTYTEAREDLARLVDAVRPWVAELGPAVASTRTAVTLRERGWTDDMLAGLAGVAVVELIRER